jgi:hypothetical protein
MTSRGDALIQRIDGVIRYIVSLEDLDLDEEQAERLIGHLTGAVFVAVTPTVIPEGDLIPRHALDELIDAAVKHGVNDQVGAAIAHLRLLARPEP